MKKAICLFVFLILFSTAAPARGAEDGRHLTIMIYLCGSDLESRYGSATGDLQEISDACAGCGFVTVLVMAGGSAEWRDGRISGDETSILEIGARGVRVVQRGPAANMGEADTLSSFLRFGRERYPASRYALILWDHGAGPMEGVCFDDRNRMDSLSLRELGEALENSPFSAENRLSWIGFDACLMASLETALRCAPYADYMVASQETEPAAGWNYSFLRTIRNGETGLETCRRILDAYPLGKKDTDILTLSVADLSKIRVVETAADRFFAAAGPLLTKYTFSAFSNGRQGTKSFGRATTVSDYDLVDLYSLTEELYPAAETEARLLRKALSGAVVQTTGNQERAGGLSVYFPYYNKKAYTDKWKETFAGFGVLPEYNRFITRYGAIWTGVQLADWTRLTGAVGPLTNRKTQRTELTLTDEQLTHFANARVIILEDAGSDTAYRNIFTIDEITLRDHTLAADYAFEALYAVDEDGVVETEAIPFRMIEDYYIVMAYLQESSVLVNPEGERLSVALICKKNGETGGLDIYNIVPTSEEVNELTFGRQTVDLQPEKWKAVRFTESAGSVTADPDGSVLPFGRWTGSDGMLIDMDAIARDGTRIPFAEWSARYDVLPPEYHQETEADNTRPWKLEFRTGRGSGRELKAQYVVTDTQGNEWGSSLISLQNPDVRAVSPIDCESRDCGDCRIRPIEAKTILNSAFQGICLRIRVENPTDESRNLILMDPVVNGVFRPQHEIRTSRRSIEAGETCIVDFYLGPQDLPYQGDLTVRSVSFIPRLLQDDGFSRENDDHRMTVETDLDVSSLLLRERPAGKVNARDELESGLCFELLGPEEAEGALLKGCAHVSNRSGRPIWIVFLSGRGDEYCAGRVNDTFVRDCFALHETCCVPADGEGYIDFEIRGNADGNLRIFTALSVPGEESEPEEKTVFRITEIGLTFCYFTDPFGTDDEGSAEMAWLQLDEPYELKAPFSLVF